MIKSGAADAVVLGFDTPGGVMASVEKYYRLYVDVGGVQVYIHL